MARTVPLFCTPSLQKRNSHSFILSLPLRFFLQHLHIPHIVNLKNLNFVKFKFLMPTRIEVSNPTKQGTRKHLVLPLNAVILKSMQSKFLNFFHIFL